MTECLKAATREVCMGNVRIGGTNPLALIAGPCVIESLEHTLVLAANIARIAADAGVPYIFKASFDKANRTSVSAYRGPGLEDGLSILDRVRRELGVPVLTDIHTEEQAVEVARVADVLQIPAFLCRQTDLLLAAARTGRAVNVKKGQFLAPQDMKNVVDKVVSAGNEKLMLTERGASFGYNNLVSDMRSLAIMRQFGYPVIFDATHSVQLPGGQGGSSGGQRQFVEPLARAATAVGIDALFVETHNDPDNAMSDGPNALQLDRLPCLLDQVKRIDAILRG